jgi:hypothetical protein
MERTDTNSFFSFETLFRERYISVEKRKVEENEEMKLFRKPTVSLYIMDVYITESSYILADPY